MGTAVEIRDDIAGDRVPSVAAASDQSRGNTALRVEKIWWGISLILGIFSLWFVKYVIYSDGVSYLEIASGYRSGNWHEALNAYWSPLYSWILAIVESLLRPAAAWEVTMLHLVNFLAFAGSLFTFRFFLRQLGALVTDRGGLQSVEQLRAWQTIAYALFLWAGLVLTPLRLVTPDAMTNLLLYAIAGVVIRIRRVSAGPRQFALLGFLFAFATSPARRFLSRRWFSLGRCFARFLRSAGLRGILLSPRAYSEP